MEMLVYVSLLIQGRYRSSQAAKEGQLSLPILAFVQSADETEEGRTHI